MHETVDEIVYKVMPRPEWERAAATGAYGGSADDRRDGFIHLSAGSQVAGTLARHFAGARDLVLIAFAAADLGGALRWEPARSGTLYPHVHGGLPTRLARSVVPLALGPDGRHVLPEPLGETQRDHTAPAGNASGAGNDRKSQR